MNWPIFYKERLWLGNIKEGYIGLVTLWTPKEKIVSQLDSEAKEKIAVVGQLYTARGAEYIFRNIWANPKIRYLIIFGEDLAKSAEGFLDLPKAEKILKDFPKKFVNLFFKKVKIIDMRGREVEELIKKLKSLKKQPPFAKKPQVFPQKKLKVGEFPSENSCFRVEGETIGEDWLQILGLILRFGRKIPRIHIYGGYERTLLNLTAVITKEEIKNPKIWPFFEFDQNGLRQYFQSFFSPQRGDQAYTYGERLFAYEGDGKKIDQVSLMAGKMKSFPYNKGAIATLWQPAIDNYPIRKPWRTPCLTLVQGFCFEDTFFLTAYFRSNDMFGAWPENVFSLRKLQAGIAEKIGKKVGDLTTISHCAFIDEGDLGRAQKIVEKNKKYFYRLDPRGNLVIEVEKEMIVVRLLSPKGRLLAEYRQDGKENESAEKLASKLLSDNVLSRPDHALYIGEQLARAEDAVKLGLKFEQDKKLKS